MNDMKESDQTLWFTPDYPVEMDQSFHIVIKGQRPNYTYFFSFQDVYPKIPSLGYKDAYHQIQKILQLLRSKLLNAVPSLTPISCLEGSTDLEAKQALARLFDPAVYHVSSLPGRNPEIVERNSIFHLGYLFPFPLYLASPEKVRHNFAWIDTNLKIQIETITSALQLGPDITRGLVEGVFSVFSYLVKADSHYLIHHMNFNHSMFIQERILQLIFGDEIFRDDIQLIEQGKLSNRIALSLFQEMGVCSFSRISTLSVFMGIVWSGAKEYQQTFLDHPSLALQEFVQQLNLSEREWGVDERNQLRLDLCSPESRYKRWLIVLDDNGESVFDLILFQHAILENPELHLTYVVNRYPISKNISESTFHSLLEMPYFLPLKAHIAAGKGRILVEQQLFRSFEQTYLQPSTRKAIAFADIAYIKGVNFFETFQLLAIPRYYAFTVHGYTSELLTGYSSGMGILVKLHQEEKGFDYQSMMQVYSLRSILKKNRKKRKN